MESMNVFQEKKGCSGLKKKRKKNSSSPTVKK